MTLPDLIEKVEGASGPDRELDARIWLPLLTVAQGAEPPTIEHLVGLDAAPSYTASLDAAMSLVPEGCKPMLDGHWNIATVSRYWTPLNGDDPGHEDFQGEGRTLALALTAACLRARVEKEGL